MQVVPLHASKEDDLQIDFRIGNRVLDDLIADPILVHAREALEDLIDALYLAHQVLADLIDALYLVLAHQAHDEVFLFAEIIHHHLLVKKMFHLVAEIVVVLVARHCVARDLL